MAHTGKRSAAVWIGDPGPVVRWRQETLERAGWPEVAAAMLAADQAVDLHQACYLLEAGCDVDLAWLIVS